MRFICSIYLLRIQSFAHHPRPDYSKICPLFPNRHTRDGLSIYFFFFRVPNAIRILVESTEVAATWKKVQLDCALTDFICSRGEKRPGSRVRKKYSAF